MAAERKTAKQTDTLNASRAQLSLPHKLRGYQRQGVAFFSQNDSALLADEMGLGKTVQTVVALRVLAGAGLCRRALVVAPRSLCQNWLSEFATWAPGLLVRLTEGNSHNRRALYHLPIPVIVSTYEQMRLDGDLVDRESPFDVVVLDEAQRIKDLNSATSIACRTIPRIRSWALTGTPFENRPADILSVFSFVRPHLLYRGISAAELHARIKPFFLRRTKAEVLPDLPPMLIQDLHLSLSGQQLRAYEVVWKSRFAQIGKTPHAASQGRLLALITRLKQLCNRDPASEESVKARRAASRAPGRALFSQRQPPRADPVDRYRGRPRLLREPRAAPGTSISPQL